MAVQQRTYTDPTAAIFQMLQGLGGSKQTTSGNPTGVSALEQILQQQLGLTTPEGLKQLIANIFEQGGKAVPQIATQYAQAAGARTSNNSNVQLANAELQKQIANKSIEAIMAAQSSAARTAGELARAGQTQITKPSFSPMQLAPFIPGILNKLKGSKLLEDVFSNGNDPIASFGVNDPSITFGGFGDSAESMASALDFGTEASGAMLDLFDSGGGSFGFNDFGVLADGGGDIISDIADSGILESAGGWLGFADGGLVDTKKLNAKPKGYANGGSVTAGPSFDIKSPSGSNIRGITYNGADSIVPILAAINRPGGGGGAYIGGGGSIRAVPENMRPAKQATGEGPGISVPSVVGTPDENAAAIAGIVGLALGQALGIPSALAGLTMSALGIPNSSMSPVGKSISVIQSLINNAIGQNDDNASVTPEGHAAAVGISGANNGGLAGLGVSLGLDVGLDAVSGMTADSSSVGGVSGVSGGDGTAVGGLDAGIGGASGSGVSADGSASSGVGGDSGVGSTSAFKRGGQVDGPGTKTSDSIVARLSDGEFVVNAEATEQFLPLLEVINAFGLKQRGASNATR